ncbi:hypothetical protein [Curtobacterium sp. MCBD17_023]|uniref:hypothetical protein n=1 Tax=Curtobacterium sp. MCBD17_023 TaxID=2175657 RepID=UPI0011B7DCB1|nr:hypothetical protein [Curtobacterium sp. MCBD17_023]
MVVEFAHEPAASSDEDLLRHYGLSSSLVHDALRRGTSRALSRSGFANAGAENTDIYHDGSEDLRKSLARSGWVVATVENQKRIVHPEALMSIVVASADNVGAKGDPRRQPLTREKGPATLNSIRKTQQADGQAFFQLPGIPDPDPVSPEALAAVAPLWMLLHQLEERTLLLELSEPAGFRVDRRVNTWRQRIHLQPLVLEDDFDFDFDASFGQPEDRPDEGVNIPIRRR